MDEEKMEKTGERARSTCVQMMTQISEIDAVSFYHNLLCGKMRHIGRLRFTATVFVRSKPVN